MNDREMGIDPRAFHVLPPQSVTVTGLEGQDGWVLDIGGGGEGIIGLVAGRRVVAIDLLASELEECSNDSLKVVMDARDLKFLDGTFDTVTAFFSFMFIPWPDLPKVFSEISRVLRPGGRLEVWDIEFQVPSGLERRGLAFLLTATLPDGRVVETGYGCESRDQGIDDFVRLGGEAGLRVESTERDGHTFRMTFRKA